MGRRVKKIVDGWDTGLNVFVPQETLTFVYDGWLLVQELSDQSSEAVAGTPGRNFEFFWGLDGYNSFQMLAGIGNMLSQISFQAGEGETADCSYDALGNLRAIVSDNVYNYKRYSNMGSLLWSSGSANSPFGFSTKYEDRETALHYYGLRYLSATSGRWLNRDSLEELVGSNIYRFVDNNPTNTIDVRGQFGLGGFFGGFVTGAIINIALQAGGDLLAGRPVSVNLAQAFQAGVISGTIASGATLVAGSALKITGKFLGNGKYLSMIKCGKSQLTAVKEGASKLAKAKKELTKAIKARADYIRKTGKGTPNLKKAVTEAAKKVNKAKKLLKDSLKPVGSAILANRLCAKSDKMVGEAIPLEVSYDGLKETITSSVNTILGLFSDLSQNQETMSLEPDATPPGQWSNNFMMIVPGPNGVPVAVNDLIHQGGQYYYPGLGNGDENLIPVPVFEDPLVGPAIQAPNGEIIPFQP